MTPDFDDLTFTRKITNNSGTAQISLAQEILNYLDADVGDEVEIGVDHGKHGKFGYFYIPDTGDG